MKLLRKIIATGRVTEPPAEHAAGHAAAAIDTDSGPGAVPSGQNPCPLPPRPEAARQLRGSLQLRHVDAGSCNGCELEIASTFGPVYDAERFGVRLVASPRHADALLVTGPVTRNMASPLRRAYEATPAPKMVIALGDCACTCGVFADAYGVEGSVADVLPVDVEVPGCPPDPDTILRSLRHLVQR